MGKSKGGSVEIPTFNPPAKTMFGLPGLGRTGFADNTWGFAEAPEAMADRLQTEALRRSILSGLGITSPQREASLNRWQDIFTKEALRTSMPQLEQTLFARGMGGSRFYQDAVTDLLSKVETQGVLNREELANRDEALKLNQLGSLQNLLQQYLTNQNTLQSQAYGASVQDKQLAQQMYMATLPYLAKYNAPKSNNAGMWGQLGGGALALALAPFTAGASLAFLPMAMQGGGAVGNLFETGQGGGPNLSSLGQLATMFAPKPVTPFNPATTGGVWGGSAPYY